jgi:hypothetical protein
VVKKNKYKLLKEKELYNTILYNMMTNMMSGEEGLSTIAHQIYYESDYEKGGNVKGKLELLKRTDYILFNDRNVNDGKKNLYLKHAIICCYQEFDMREFESIKQYFKGTSVQKSYFNSLNFPGSDISRLQTYVQRFERLTYIICMNPYLINNVVEISDYFNTRSYSVFNWYKKIKDDITVEWRTARYSVDFTNKSRANTIKKKVGEYIKKVNDLYKSLKSQFEKLEKLENHHQSERRMKKSIGRKTVYNTTFRTKNGNEYVNGNGNGTRFNNFNNFNFVRNNSTESTESALTSSDRGEKEYVKLGKGGRRLLRYGSRGGRYYMKGGKRNYLNNLNNFGLSNK